MQIYKLIESKYPIANNRNFAKIRHIKKSLNFVFINGNYEHIIFKFTKYISPNFADKITSNKASIYFLFRSIDTLFRIRN